MKEKYSNKLPVDTETFLNRMLLSMFLFGGLGIGILLYSHNNFKQTRYQTITRTADLNGDGTPDRISTNYQIYPDTSYHNTQIKYGLVRSVQFGTVDGFKIDTTKKTCTFDYIDDVLLLPWDSRYVRIRDSLEELARQDIKGKLESIER
jgi:hypothetical protein